MSEEWVWVPDSGWVVDPLAHIHPCRFMSKRVQCRKPSVAYLLRPRFTGKQSPYYYCADHLYGRKFKAGQVWVSVHPDSPMVAECVCGEINSRNCPVHGG